jgi:hypothetical protein
MTPEMERQVRRCDDLRRGEGLLLRGLALYLILTAAATGVLTLFVGMQLGNAIFIALHISLLVIIGLWYLTRPDAGRGQERE